MHEDTRMQLFNYTSVPISRYIYSMITFLTRNLRALGKVGFTTSEAPVELQAVILRKPWKANLVLLTPFQIISHFNFCWYVHFAMHLDIIICLDT